LLLACLQSVKLDVNWITCCMKILHAPSARPGE
jgi:hypothetical protein